MSAGDKTIGEVPQKLFHQRGDTVHVLHRVQIHSFTGGEETLEGLEFLVVSGLQIQLGCVEEIVVVFTRGRAQTRERETA
jgi:hypothetical protein